MKWRSGCSAILGTTLLLLSGCANRSTLAGVESRLHSPDTLRATTSFPARVASEKACGIAPDPEIRCTPGNVSFEAHISYVPGKPRSASRTIQIEVTEDSFSAPGVPGTVRRAQAVLTISEFKDLARCLKLFESEGRADLAKIPGSSPQIDFVSEQGFSAGYYKSDDGSERLIFSIGDSSADFPIKAIPAVERTVQATMADAYTRVNGK